jgi:site-specific DNA recombinase
MKKAVILARVSTREQEEHGHSLDAQLDRLRDYAARNGIEVVREFSFSESAGQKIRKKFEEVLAFIKRTKDVNALLCMNVDRATRNFRDAVDLDEMRKNDGLAIHFVQDGFVLDAEASGSAMFMWEAKVFIAKQYINRLTDDAKRSMDHKIQNGEWIAKAPVGYKNITDETTGKRTVALDEERAFLVRRIFQEYSTGCYSLEEVAGLAKGWGLSNVKSGRPLSTKQVHEIMQNPFYYGSMRIKGNLYPHCYPPIIDVGLFDKCQKTRTRTKKVPFAKTEKPFVFRGLLTCAKCGCAYSSEIKKERYIYLRPTKSKGSCDCFQINEKVILDQVAEVFDKIKVPAHLMEPIRQYLKDSLASQKSEYEAALTSIKAKHARICTMQTNLLDMRLDGSITKDEYDKKAYSLQQERMGLEQQIQEHGQADDDFMNSVEAVFSLASHVPHLFASSEIPQKRKLLAFVFSNLSVNGKTLEFTLRKPFDLFHDADFCEEWRPLRDSNPCYRRERAVS